jgi:NAD(P)-dependent dehydrogenase (short-subunit alcohol dehydrogenase family)
MDIKGRVALVTGANRGIGAAIVEALIAAGAGRVYAAMRTPNGAPSHPNVVPIALDVTDPAQVVRVAEATADVEILVNNAGLALGQSLLTPSDPLAAKREMQVNYFGTLRMCQAYAPVLKKNGGGAIVNVLSILSRVSMPQLGSYAASKAATFSLTQAVRGELAAQGTLVIGVMPGFVDTEMAKRVTTEKVAPQAVAQSIIDALASGTEDVYPGPASAIASGLLQDPKAVERQFATLLARSRGPVAA